MNLFEKNGLKLDLLPFQSTDQMTQSLAAKQIDIASAPASEGVFSFNANNPESIWPFFFNVYTSKNMNDVIVVANNSSITKTSDLSNKRIAIIPANMMKVALAGLIKKYNLTNVEVIAIPPSTILSALASGDVDACYLIEPLIAISLAKMNAKVLLHGLASEIISDPLPAGFH